jgi:hypothetical protein
VTCLRDRPTVWHRCLNCAAQLQRNARELEQQRYSCKLCGYLMCSELCFKEFLLKYKEDHAKQCKTFCEVRYQLALVQQRLADALRRGQTRPQISRAEQNRLATLDNQILDRITERGAARGSELSPTMVLLSHVKTKLCFYVLDNTKYADVLRDHGSGLHHCGAHAAALHVLVRSLQYSSILTQGLICEDVGMALVGLQRFAEAALYYERGLRVAQYVNDAERVANLIMRRGDMHTLQRDYVTAEIDLSAVS